VAACVVLSLVDGMKVPFLGTADLMWLRLESCLGV